MERRDFLKIAGAAGIAAGAAASGVAGSIDARNPMHYIGWEHAQRGFEGIFDRRPFEVDEMVSKQVGIPRQPHYLLMTHSLRGFYDRLFTYPDEFKTTPDSRINFENYLHSLITVDQIDSLPFSFVTEIGAVPYLQTWYEEIYRQDGHNYMAEDLRYFMEVRPFARQKERDLDFELRVFRAMDLGWLAHMRFHGSRIRSRGTDPIATNSDFIMDTGQHVNDIPRYEIRDPVALTNMVKEIAARFGSNLTRIVRINPHWAFDRSTTHHRSATFEFGRGYRYGERVEIPDHWQYGIVVSHSMHWETTLAGSMSANAMDGYSQVSIIAARMSEFIKRLGYPARENSPNAGYEFVLPPFMEAGGFGELSRTGMVITPEFGLNLRPAMVVTNMPLVPDKPVNLNITRFCEQCKICADACPVGAISHGERREIRENGYLGWHINVNRCHNHWRLTPSLNCDVCLISCPFTQTQGALHRFARNLVARDPTGLSDRLLVWMEKNFYGVHPPEHFIYQHGSQIFGWVREQPWYMNTAHAFNRRIIS